MTELQLKFRREEVIQWVFRTSRSSVPIVGLPSLSALRTKNSTKPKALLMNQNAAPHVARRKRPSEVRVAVVVSVATDHPARCSQRPVPHAGNRPRFLSSLAVISQCTVVIATEKTDRPDKLVWDCGHTWAGDTHAEFHLSAPSFENDATGNLGIHLHVSRLATT